MAEELGPPSAEAKVEPDWHNKILLLNSELANHGIPYAFGGAIAMNYHREPRATLDIDINIFLPPGSVATVLPVLGSLYPLESEELQRKLSEDGQARSL